MNRAASHQPGRRGVSILLTAALLGAIIPVVGLAIDASLLYAIKARLSAAADSAALAGARSLQRGLSLAEQVDSARSTAQAFFNANFPDGYLMTNNRLLVVTVAESAYKTRTVRMEASVDAPAYFMRLLGFNLTTVRVVGMASRRDVNLILLIDRSGSVAYAGADDDVRASAKAFVDKFAEGRDRLGLISFSGAYSVDFAHGMDFRTRAPQNLSQTIDGLNFPSGGAYTGTAQGLYQAYQQLVNIGEQGALNLIVFFTDGRPTALTANFPVKTVSDTRYRWDFPSSTTTYPASPCTSSTAKFGFICADPCITLPCNLYPATGTTYGVMKADAATSFQNEWTVAPGSTGCNYAPLTTSSNRRKARMDIAYIPDQDQHGINIKTGYLSPDLYSGGPYVGKVRVDSPRALRYAANNLANNTATHIRSDATLIPVIYAIGLGGTSAEPVDHDLLLRIANDPTSPSYVSSQPTGLYVYAPTSAQLNEAFARVASEILRLAL